MMRGLAAPVTTGLWLTRPSENGDRARYDGQRLANAFAGRLRDEVDIATVTTDLDATVRAAVRPTTLGLWVRGPR